MLTVTKTTSLLNTIRLQTITFSSLVASPKSMIPHTTFPYLAPGQIMSTWISLCSIKEVRRFRYGYRYELASSIKWELQGQKHKFSDVFISKYLNIYYSCTTLSLPIQKEPKNFKRWQTTFYVTHKMHIAKFKSDKCVRSVSKVSLFFSFFFFFFFSFLSVPNFLKWPKQCSFAVHSQRFDKYVCVFSPSIFGSGFVPSIFYYCYDFFPLFDSLFFF